MKFISIGCLINWTLRKAPQKRFASTANPKDKKKFEKEA